MNRLYSTPQLVVAGLLTFACICHGDIITQGAGTGLSQSLMTTYQVRTQPLSNSLNSSGFLADSGNQVSFSLIMTLPTALAGATINSASLDLSQWLYFWYFGTGFGMQSLSAVVSSTPSSPCYGGCPYQPASVSPEPAYIFGTPTMITVGPTQVQVSSQAVYDLVALGLSDELAAGNTLTVSGISTLKVPAPITYSPGFNSVSTYSMQAYGGRNYTATLSVDYDASTPSVPDDSITLALLGGALVGLETLRRRIKVSAHP